MRPVILAAAAAIMLSAGSIAAQAQYFDPWNQAVPEGPWCARVNIGFGSIREYCHYRSFEECRREVISGNKGFCNQNPRFTGYAEPVRKTYRKRKAAKRAR